jgi:hypothetical protein
MTPRKSLEDRLDEIADLARGGPTPEGREALRRHLRSKNNLVAARAAQAVREWSARELLPELRDLWERSMRDPLKSDRACHAKVAVVEALDALGHHDFDLFLQGARHVQLEPSYGPPVDAAVDLRGICARILASRGYADIHVVLADLLMDREPGARKAAAVLAADLGGEVGEILLRMRVLAGEDHTENYAAYFNGLLALAPERSLPLVESLARHEDPALAEEAILALGESHLPGAFPILKEIYDSTVLAEDRRPVLMGISLLRTPQAVDFLEEVVLSQDSASARQVLEALWVFRGTENVMERFRKAVELREDPELDRVLGAVERH